MSSEIKWNNNETNTERMRKVYNATNNLLYEMQDGKVEVMNVPISITFVKMAEKGEIDEVTASEHAEMFLAWRPGMQCTTGMFLQHEGRLYRVLQDHTSQEDWTPDLTPALYKVVGINENGIPEYSRPVSSSDAYMTGDEMMFKGVHYRSKIDYNVWTPEEYADGWEVVE